MKRKVFASVTSISVIEQKILVIRGEKIILDTDLAELYGVSTWCPKSGDKEKYGAFPE